VQDAHAALNAALNLTSGVLLFVGWRAIKGGDRERHKRLMLSALGVSVLFLVSYVSRMALAGEPKRFPDAGWVKGLYLAILLTHTVLAAAVPFLALRTVFLAWKERWESHRRLARFTFPIWIYVSVTGVVIYGMLYHLAPALGEA
jgi:putative membrane protein